MRMSYQGRGNEVALPRAPVRWRAMWTFASNGLPLPLTGLSFLDFCIYEKNNHLEIKNKSKFTVPMNFAIDTAPLQMKKGLLVSELKRSKERGGTVPLAFPEGFGI